MEMQLKGMFALLQHGRLVYKNALCVFKSSADCIDGQDDLIY